MCSLDVKEDATSLVFNVSGLKLGDLTVTSPAFQEDHTYLASDLKIDATQERATLPLSSTLSAGVKAQLKVGFEGELTGAMLGYYRSTWETEGKTKYYTLTQFEVGLRVELWVLTDILCSPRQHVEPFPVGMSQH